MTKAEVLAEIKRTASENGGIALGMRTFEARTGIGRAVWFGVYWRSWGDAVEEAGLTPNAPTSRIDDEDILRKYSLLARELCRFPTSADFRLKKRRDPSFPGDTTLMSRFGSYRGLRSKARDWCASRSEFGDVVPMLSVEPIADPGPDRRASVRSGNGFVYLIKHGARSDYKIGKTLNPLRREGEIRLQLPEKLTPVHYIETDDPSGIETYWHTRFAEKRKEGEWFALSRDDVAAFKRWKRIN